MRILTFTTLYPSAARPHFGIFVETRLRHLVASGHVSARVVAPCPWFPFTSARFGSYAVFARIPRSEERHRLSVDHPRYLQIPKLGMAIAPLLLFASAFVALRRQIALGRDFDVIDAHYMYPDGVAAILLGRALSRPVTITCRGSDINVISQYALPRRQIVWAARKAAALVTVSEALRQRLIGLGIPSGKIRVLRNGVDLYLFRPLNRSELRAKFDLTGHVLLSVGNLVPLKGQALIITALQLLPEATLLIIGSGPLEKSLRERARQSGVADRVRFITPVAQERLCEYYNVADVLVLPSEHEGWPNVLLESMACGTPVLASNIPSAQEIVGSIDAGRLLPERSAEAIAASARELLASPPERHKTRLYAENFDWQSTTRAQIAMFEEIALGKPSGPPTSRTTAHSG